MQDTTRRDFLKTGTTAALAAGLVATGVHAAGSDEIKVGIIGTGGRGNGAGSDVLRAAKGVTIHALGDAFEERAYKAKKDLEGFAASDEEVKKLGNKTDVGERVFVGLDAYKRVIESGVNYVVLATPPGFRPIHIEAAVEAGKTLFTEKPVAVDGPGIKRVLAAFEKAKEKKLAVAAGTQRRHQAGYLETIKRIHDGEIGDVVAGRCYWNQPILWSVPRQKGWTDLQWQLKNWYNFTWLCGDHIVEQHVHNIDVINWAMKQKHPVAAVGMGGRSRNNPDYGHIFDFFSVDFEYANDVHVHSMARQICGCWNSVSEAVQGTKGWSQIDAYAINKKNVYPKRKDNRPYIQEHTDLIESVRKGSPINELENVAYSTLTAIMGRMSAYTGVRVTAEMALNSKEVLMPENLEWNMKLPVPPVAVPGKTKFV